MTIERPDAAYGWLLDRLRESLPEVARQVEEEVARGRRVGAGSLPERDQEMLQQRLRGAGSRMSKDDLASVDYSGQERLVLLIDAIDRLGSSMVASREAIVGVLNRQEVRPSHIRFRQVGEGDTGVQIDPRPELERAQAAYQSVEDGLGDALGEVP